MTGSRNNKGTVTQVAELELPPDPATPEPKPAPSKIMIDVEYLTTGDMERAEETLGFDPWDVVSGEDGGFNKRVTLIIWCIRSRSDPAFTWEQAKAVPMGQMIFPKQPPDPQTPARAKPGSTTSAPAETG